MKRTKFTPERGKIYKNAGGGTFRCLRPDREGRALMQNVVSGWTVTAIGCGIYEDGTIDWDYSGKDGHFEGVSA